MAREGRMAPIMGPRLSRSFVVSIGTATGMGGGTYGTWKLYGEELRWFQTHWALEGDSLETTEVE
jgi:hypothetical protein